MNGVKILCVIAASTLLVLVVPELPPLAQSQEEDDTEEEDTEEEEDDTGDGDTEEEDDTGDGDTEEGTTGQITNTEVGNAMGQITNSKYLIIAGVILNQNDNQINIGGTIANNSTDQAFTNVVVVAALYDEANKLITTASGVPGFANLNPGQQSSFAITTNIPSDEELGRYVVLPGGSAAS
jgi:hypothetical protein